MKNETLTGETLGRMVGETICGLAPVTATESDESAIDRFIALDREYPKIREWLDTYREAKRAVFAELGCDQYFQDDEGIVYKTEEIEGKFVYFDPVEIKRTKRDGETRGSLSVKEATEAGFTVPFSK